MSSTQQRAAADASGTTQAGKKTMRNPRPWVIVENPGTDVEDVYSDHKTFADAQRALKNAPEGCDIMKRLDDGTLTTEF